MSDLIVGSKIPESTEHSDEFMTFFEKIVEPVPEENFEKRVESLRMKQQPNTI